MWKLNLEKRLENKEGAWTYPDKKWILPAEGAEGGPIQDFETGNVLTIMGNDVTLVIKKEKEEQRWEKHDVPDVPDFFFLNTDDRHLSTATSEILTGTSTSLFLLSCLRVHSFFFFVFKKGTVHPY